MVYKTVFIHYAMSPFTQPVMIIHFVAYGYCTFVCYVCRGIISDLMWNNYVIYF